MSIELHHRATQQKFLSVSIKSVTDVFEDIVIRFHLMKNDIKIKSTKAVSIKGFAPGLWTTAGEIEMSNVGSDLLDKSGSLTVQLEVCLTLELSEVEAMRHNGLKELGRDMASMRNDLPDLSDVTILCQDKSFPAHRAFLSARSEVRNNSGFATAMKSTRIWQPTFLPTSRPSCRPWRPW